MTDLNQTTINGDCASPAHIVHHPTLPLPTKRSVLASWASDARAVPDHPSLRRLDDGRLVDIDEILDALKALDAFEMPPGRPNAGGVAPLRRGHWSRLSRTWRRGRDDDDDDDDPPPTVAARRPRSPVLSGGLAEAA